MKKKLFRVGIDSSFSFNFIILKDINIFCYSKYFNNFYNILKVIQNSVNFKLKILNDIFVSDYLFYKKRFKVCYNFLSNFFLKYYYFIFSIKLLERAISINYIFKSALWMEREVFDMFGIIFINNWDLRKILTDYTFFGFPLRKDFPLSGYLELIFCEIKRITFETLIELMQEFRFFLNTSYIELWDHQ